MNYYDQFVKEKKAEDRRRTLASLPLIDVAPGRWFTRRRCVLPIAALIVAGSSVAMSLPRREETAPITRDLIGWWNTIDARYADRGFRISASTLTLMVPDSGHMDFEILHVDVEEKGRTRSYEIQYTGPSGDPLYFGFDFDSVIRFHNQTGIIWRRGDDPSLRPALVIDSLKDVARPSDLEPGFAECIKSVTANRRSDRPVSCLDRAGGAPVSQR